MLVAEEQITAQLHKILESSCFREKRKLRDLLEYLVAEALAGRTTSERTIGVVVWELPQNFRVQDNVIVRGAIWRLRKTLNTYYGTDGRADDIVISVPKMKHHAVFTSSSGEPIVLQPPDDPAVVSPPSADDPDDSYLLIIRGKHSDLLLLALRVEPELRKLSGYAGLKIRAAKKNSIYIYFTCSQEGFRRLQEARKTGELQEAIGSPILDLRPEPLESIERRSVTSRIIDFFAARPTDIALAFATPACLLFSFIVFMVTGSTWDIPPCPTCTIAAPAPGEIERQAALEAVGHHIAVLLLNGFYVLLFLCVAAFLCRRWRRTHF